jgi:hypothetical protein
MKKLATLLTFSLVLIFGSSVLSFPASSAARPTPTAEITPPSNSLHAMLPKRADELRDEGVAQMQPVNRSGIRALMHVRTIGRTNMITGMATGLDPHKAYVSVFYDAGSPGDGPCACLPTTPSPRPDCKSTNAPPLAFSQMVVGYWLPLIGSSVRTLSVLKFGPPEAAVPLAFVPLEHIGSVSVREDTQLGTPLPERPDPARFQLRACGKFRIEK